MPDEAVPLPVADMGRVYASVHAVRGPESAARVFARLWSEARGVRASVGARQRLHRLDAVVPPDNPPPDELRPATPDDIDLSVDWTERFMAATRMRPIGVRASVERRITARSLWIWEQADAAKSIAAEGSPIPHGARIGYVFTPVEWRGRGYASACVATLSQKVLEAGAQFCCLYTDLSNLASNSIYRRIAYRPVRDVVNYWFHERDG